MSSFARDSALFLRSLYACLIVLSIVTGRYGNAISGAVVFFALLPLPFLARKDSGLHWLDAALLLLFIAAWFAPSAGLALNSSIFGPDKIFHFTGGALLGAIACRLLRQKKPSKMGLVVAAAAFSFVVGFAWEVFEWLFDAFVSPLHLTVIDSVLDLVADTLGAVVVALFVAKEKK